MEGRRTHQSTEHLAIQCWFYMKQVLISELLLEKHDSNKVSCIYQSTWSNITSFFVAYFFITFPRALSSFHPSTVRIIFLLLMAMVGIIRSYYRDLWRIRRCGQSTNTFFRVNRYGSWKQIMAIAGYFIQVGSIINGNGS